MYIKYTFNPITKTNNTFIIYIYICQTFPYVM